jgi:hypothetical protein
MDGLKIDMLEDSGITFLRNCRTFTQMELVELKREPKVIFHQLAVVLGPSVSIDDLLSKILYPNGHEIGSLGWNSSLLLIGG